MDAIDRLRDLALSMEESRPNQWNLYLEAPDLLRAVQILREARWGYLSAITGLDLGPEAGVLELLYHFCDANKILTLRVRIPRTCPEIESLTHLIASARLYEMEVREMLGVEFNGLNADKHLFLPDNWEDGAYPLRKDFELR